MTNVSVASQLDELETADPTNRSKSSPVPPRLPKEPPTWYLGPSDNPSQQDWLVLVPTAQPKRQGVYWKLIRLKKSTWIWRGRGMSHICLLVGFTGVEEVGNLFQICWEILATFHLAPWKQPSPLPPASRHNHFPLLFYARITTVINTPHSYFSTSVKSKRWETLPRKFSLEARAGFIQR